MPGAPHLSSEDIKRAKALLEGWTGKLTWKLYLATLAVELESGHTYSKVTMLKQGEIRSAWDKAHARLREEAESVGEKSYGTSAVAALRRRLDETRSELAEARQLINESTEQFQRWQFNAERYGLKLSQLDAPLPKPTQQKAGRPDR
jgi:hypothetical protein